MSRQCTWIARHLLQALTALFFCTFAVLGDEPKVLVSPSDLANIEGFDALKGRQWTKATQFFSVAIEANSNSASSHCGRAVASMMAGNTTAAAVDFDRANLLNPSDAITRKWYEALLRSLGQSASISRVIRGGPSGDKSDAHGTGTRPAILADIVNQIRDETTRRSEPSPVRLAELRARVEQFAVEYAETALAQPEMYEALFKRMDANFIAGRYAETLNDLVPLMHGRPLDSHLLQVHAVCFRNAGKLLQAREEFTRVLTDWPDYSAAYSERAIVEARLGNLARAKADLAQAVKYDAVDAKEMTPLVEKEIGAYAIDPASESPAKLFAALRESAEAGHSLEQLLPAAVALEKCMNAHRLRWDEGYQDRLRELSDPVRAKPTDIHARLALGEFLFREADVLGERAGPWGAIRPFRFEGNGQSDRELDLADEQLDAVLAADPRNVMAMTWKAAIRINHDRWDEGESWVHKAFAIRSDVPQLLELLTRVLDATASAKNYQAGDLRTTKTWIEYGEIYDTHWTRQPSREELATANAMELLANHLWENAETDLTKAAQASTGTADGYYYIGLLNRRHGKNDQAIASFFIAASMDPSRRNTDALVRAFFQAKQFDEAVHARSKFNLTRETTATPYLSAAWVNIQNGAYDKARKFLDDAVAIDPCDSRIAAYTASIATRRGKTKEAFDWYNVALALEEAIANLDGVSLWHGTGPLTAEQAGRTLLIDLRASARAAELGRHEDEQACLQRNLEMESRLGSTDLATPAYSTVLPNPNDPKITKPKTPQSALAWTHLLIAYDLLAKGQNDQAAVHFQHVWDWPHAPGLYAAQQRAIAGVTRLQWAKQDPDPSLRRQWLASASLRRGLSREEIARLSQLNRSANADNVTFMRYAEDSTSNVFDADRSNFDDAPTARVP